MTERERIAALEVRAAAVDVKLAEIDKKLDDLLALRHKGMGAFWLASGLVGTGIIGFLATVFDFFKG